MLRENLAFFCPEVNPLSPILAVDLALFLVINILINMRLVKPEEHGSILLTSIAIRSIIP